jgi:hypothetical protein
MTNEPTPAGCAMALVGLGSFVAGIYHGLSDAKGTPMDSHLEQALLYGPSIVGGMTGLIFARQVYEESPQMQDAIANMPPEQRGCALGCGSLAGGAISAGLANGAGYFIGNWLGKIA